MSAHITFWLEVRRAFARWMGVVLASILSGVLLGILRRQGMAYKPALEIALPVGFSLALLFWIWISHRVSAASVPVPIPIAVAVPSTVPTFDGEWAGAFSYQGPVSPTFACQKPA